MTNYHRPSLKNWRGWPWEFERILPQALNRGVHRQSPVQVMWTEKTVKEILETSPGVRGRVGLFKEVWSLDRGIGDVDEIVMSAVEEVGGVSGLSGELVLMRPVVKRLKQRK
jgi:hypothetical protein